MELVQLPLFFLSLPSHVFGKIQYNTFAVQTYKSTTFTPQVIDKTCLLIPDPGPCRAEIPMYYYNPKVRNCTLFDWGGCQGNGNRFDTRKQCIDSCLSKTNAKTRPKWCNLSFDYGYCFGAIKRWYYDHNWKVCKETIYSGCGGNKNNFYSIEQCDSVCRFGNGMIDFFRSKKRDNLKKFLIIETTTKKSTGNSFFIPDDKKRHWLSTSTWRTPAPWVPNKPVG